MFEAILHNGLKDYPGHLHPVQISCFLNIINKVFLVPVLHQFQVVFRMTDFILQRAVALLLINSGVTQHVGKTAAHPLHLLLLVR